MSLEKIGEIFTINRRITMEKVIQHAKRIWTLAMANKKTTIGIIVAVVILYELATR